MLIRRSSPVRNFTVLPNEFLQDERMSWVTRGILGEILSRPEGWQASADSMAKRATKVRGERVGEGRRAVRAAFAEAEKLGYIVRSKERIAAGAADAGQFVTVLTFYDAPRSARQGTDTGTSVPPAETGRKARSHQGTADGTSVTGTSIERTEKKEPRSTKDYAIAQAPDKSEASSQAPAIAEVRAGAPTTKSGSTGETARIPKQRKPYPSNEERDNDWRAQIAAADIDELDNIAGTVGSHGKTAGRLAAFRLGLGANGSVPDELRPQHIRHMYLYLLKEVAATDPEHLDEFLYPLDTDAEPVPAAYKWDRKVQVPAGEPVSSLAARMCQAARCMPPEHLGPWVGEIEDFLPGLWYKKRHEARELVQAQGLPLEIETIASVAVRLVIEYYAGKSKRTWPMEVVPPSMRFELHGQGAPPEWAAHAA